MGTMPKQAAPAGWWGVSLASVLLWTTVGLMGQAGTKNGEWPFYNGDAGSTRYAPFDQINEDNVQGLRIAWRWKTDNFGPQPNFNYQATPLMVGSVLYVTAGSQRHVVAIDAETGETLWVWRYNEGARGEAAAPGRIIEVSRTGPTAARSGSSTLHPAST